MSSPQFSYPTRARKQRGNALVFTLLALVIGAVVVAVGLNQYNQSERAGSIQSVVTEVTTIIGSAKANDGQIAYSGLTTAIAVGGGTIPRDRHTSTSTAKNKFSGDITLVDNNATTQGTAILTYANVPQDQCKEIVMGTQSLARQVQVAGTDVKALDSTINPATLNTQCLSANAVSIAWIIGRA
jgi:Tfp pilus assembly protein PilX